MKIKIFFSLLTAISFFFSTLSGTSFGAYKEATISDFSFAIAPEDIKISFKVNDCFTSEIEEAILNGIPTTFIFKVKVKKERKKWTDLLVQERTFKHTIKYDILNKTFSISFLKKEMKFKLKILLKLKIFFPQLRILKLFLQVN